jgi:hypothetical protein
MLLHEPAKASASSASLAQALILQVLCSVSLPNATELNSVLATCDSSFAPLDVPR